MESASVSKLGKLGLPYALRTYSEDAISFDKSESRQLMKSNGANQAKTYMNTSLEKHNGVFFELHAKLFGHYYTFKQSNL